jgi:hypothetical protein
VRRNRGKKIARFQSVDSVTKNVSEKTIKTIQILPNDEPCSGNILARKEIISKWFKNFTNYRDWLWTSVSQISKFQPIRSHWPADTVGARRALNFLELKGGQRGGSAHPHLLSERLPRSTKIDNAPHPPPQPPRLAGA